jgi:type IV secretion system protein VirB8
VRRNERSYASSFVVFAVVSGVCRMRYARGALPRRMANNQYAAAVESRADAISGESGEVDSVKSESLAEYFHEAASWDADRLQQVERNARRAWQAALGGWLCALAMAFALVLLMPLKRVDPFLVRVDSSTGIVDVVPVYTGKAGLEQAITRYFLSHYISVCERFNFATAESDYEECGAFHAAQRNQVWYALWNPSNPASPLNVHKDGSTLRVQVEAVSFFQRVSGVTDLAQVRYLKAVRQGSSADERVSHWIATVQYAYAAPSSDPRVRRWNPLGFKVLELTTEAEADSESTATKPDASGHSP